MFKSDRRIATSFFYENANYVCSKCGGSDWNAVQIWSNVDKLWYDDDDHFYCVDCDGKTELSLRLLRDDKLKTGIILQEDSA